MIKLETHLITRVVVQMQIIQKMSSHTLSRSIYCEAMAMVITQLKNSLIIIPVIIEIV